MDEVLFRSSQKLENFQVQVALAAEQGKNVLQQYSSQTKTIVGQLKDKIITDDVRNITKDLWIYVLNICRDVKRVIISNLKPEIIYTHFIRIFGKQWTKTNICFGCAGLILGGLVGFAIGAAFRRQEQPIRYMQAIQCNQYLGSEAITVVEDAIAPYECGPNDVLINVKAASIHPIDALICNGYGRKLRWLLSKYNRFNKHELPVILGRDCTGIITDIGNNVTRLEVGDEVWLTVPFWSQGTLSQTVLATQCKVSRKPKNIGFEGACSLPYAGSTALFILEQAKLNAENTSGKRILITDGCTPVGCALIQILKVWSAHITTTCHKRSKPVATALGADDIIVNSGLASNKSALNLPSEEQPLKILPKELELRDSFDLIVVTKQCELQVTELAQYCTESGQVISACPPSLRSDSFGPLMTALFWMYIRAKCSFMKFFSSPLSDFDEVHMCRATLDRLSGFVEEGQLQTVVDKVFYPADVELALAHIQSNESIGSTVITFR